MYQQRCCLSHGHDGNFIQVMANWTYLSTLANSFPNVWIYVLRHEDLKENMKALFGGNKTKTTKAVTMYPGILG